MTNVNAAIGIAQLERLDEMVAAKQAIAARYDDLLANRPDIRPMPRPEWAAHNCWLYNVRLRDAEAAGTLVARLGEQGIEARRFWRALSAQAPYAASPRLLRGKSAGLSGSVVTLPCSSHLTVAEQGRVLEVLRGWSGSAIPAMA